MNLGSTEIFFLLIVLAVLIVPVIFIYRYGKQKGRLEEKQRQEGKHNQWAGQTNGYHIEPKIKKSLQKK